MKETYLLHTRLIAKMKELRVKYPDGDLVIQASYGFRSEVQLKKAFEKRLEKLSPGQKALRFKELQQAREELDLIFLCLEALPCNKEIRTLPILVKKAREENNPQDAAQLEKLRVIAKRFDERPGEIRYLIGLFLLRKGSKEVLERYLQIIFKELPQAEVAWNNLSPHYQDLLGLIDWLIQHPKATEWSKAVL